MLIVPEYPPYNIGGGGIVYENLALNLNKFGHKVTVIWGYYPSSSIFEKITQEEINGIKFFRVPEIPYLKSKPFLRTAMPPNISGLISLPKIIKKEKPDLIHLHGYGLPYITFCSIISHLLNIHYLFTIHGYPKTPEINKVFRIIWNIYDKTLMKSALHHSKKITCVSKWIAEDERLDCFQDKVKVIYNGINQGKFLNKKKNNDINIYKKFHLSENSQLICSVGRISKMKGFHMVINILPKLLNDFPDVYYFIIGADDGYKRRLEQIAGEKGIKNRIIFTGFIDEVIKNKIIKESDVFIVPSLWEPFGLTALEGLALEKIVITSGEGGLKEFLSDCKNVLFYDQNDDASIVTAIKKVLNGEKKYQHDTYLQTFNWEHIVQEYVQVYDQIGMNKKYKKVIK